MSSIWALLVGVLGEAKRRNVVASSPTAAGGGAGSRMESQRYVEAIVAGARRYLEEGHQRHMRATITRYKLVAERGPDPDNLRDVQAYVQVRKGQSWRLDVRIVYLSKYGIYSFYGACRARSMAGRSVCYR